MVMKIYENFVIYFVAVIFGLFVFFSLPESYLLKIKLDDFFGYLLTTNSIFIAILISYFLNRVTWVKELKTKTFSEAELISRKITDYRRILKVLTNYYQVWKNQESTKSLLDHGKYKNVDYFDFQKHIASDKDYKERELYQNLFDNKNYLEGESTTYLAMVSLVSDRTYDGYYYDETLYKDFEIEGVYNLKTINRWMESNIVGSIAYWLNGGTDWINYRALKNHKKEVLFFASRINKKYTDYEFNDKLIEELSEDMNEHYFPKLIDKLEYLEEGIVGLNLFLLTLISLSSIFGVLFPLLLLLIDNKINFYYHISSVVIAINIIMISIFVLKFPFLIKSEIQYK